MLRDTIYEYTLLFILPSPPHLYKKRPPKYHYLQLLPHYLRPPPLNVSRPFSSLSPISSIHPLLPPPRFCEEPPFCESLNPNSFQWGDYHLHRNMKNTKPSLFCQKGSRLTFEALVKQMYCQHFSITIDSLMCRIL